MNTNYYLTELEKSYVWFDAMKMKSIAKGELDLEEWAKLYDFNHIATPLEKTSLSQFFTSKTAIVVLGFSCSGKTTIATNLKKNYPTADLICFDFLGLEIVKENFGKAYCSADYIDQQMSYLLGEKISSAAKKHTPLIIEGQYVYANVRGAVFNTLRYYGYENIIIVSTLKINNSIIEKMLANRITDTLYIENIQKKYGNEAYINKQIEYYAKDISALKFNHKKLEEWRKLPEYKYNEKLLLTQIQTEVLETMYTVQVSLNLLPLGADYWCEWF